MHLLALSSGEFVFVIFMLLFCTSIFTYIIILFIKRVFIALFEMVDEVYYFLTGKQILKNYNIFYRKLSTHEKQILYNFSAYYRNLPEEIQHIFEHRVATFCRTKQFIGKEDFLIDSEKKICIASVAIKLTFGYRHYNYEHFQKIIVYPNAYYSPRMNEYHLGETSLGGYIILSWKSFVEGEQILHDNKNLGLHEFAHALFINELTEHENYIFSNWISKWETGVNKLKPIIEKMEIFRNYAFTNKMEFFAVAIEHFFETPEEFQAKLPNAFEIMCKLLNQNPLKITHI